VSAILLMCRLTPDSHASIISTLRCNHPSAYAASLINSSSGALKGTLAPCSTGSATIASLLLGNRLGNILLRAMPSVWTSRLGVRGGISAWTILIDARGVDDVGEAGIYIRRGMFRSGVEGLRRMDVIFRWAERSLSCTEFHSCVELSFDMDMIPFAVPLRMKSASFTLLMNVSWISNNGPCPSVNRHGNSGLYKSQRRPIGRFFSRMSSYEKLEQGPKKDVRRGSRRGR